jgi:hypothetical protein
VGLRAGRRNHLGQDESAGERKNPEGSFLNGVLRLWEKVGAYRKIGALLELAPS